MERESITPSQTSRVGAPALTPHTLLAERYTIMREVGQGGMATVYLAQELKHGRAVAIKVLRPDLGAALGPERFMREIGIAARLSHPHLVPLIDSGEAGGLLYYVSAYLSGGSLRDRLRKESRLPIEDAVRITREVGAGLQYAHREGFIHRDVKPENILFAEGLALLADFGVARACCAEKLGGVELVTGTGFAVGTPEYMSPEQAAGEQNLDARSDIYSLGCVLFEMLTGEPPFRGHSPQTTMAKQVVEPPRRVRALRPEVPAAIDAAVARALAKDPQHRFQSVTELCSALEVESATRGRVSPGSVRGIAVLPFVNASPDPDNEYLSDGITDELIDALAKVHGIRVASRTSVFALKGKPQDVRAVGALLDASVVLEGTVRRSGQQVRVTGQLVSTDDGRLLWSQKYDRKLDDVFAIQDEIARTIVNTLLATSLADLPQAPTSKRHTANPDAYQLYLKGRYEWNQRTGESMNAAIRHFEDAIALDPKYALAYAGLADCYSIGADYRSVPIDEGYRAAKEYARKAIELDDSLAEAHASLAWSTFVYDWNWDEADRQFRRAIDLDPRYPSAHQWYAFVLASRGNIPEALVEAHTAVELDPGSVSARRSLGYAYYYARRYDQARYHLDKAIAMNPKAEETYRVYGLVLALEGKFEEAIRVLRESVAMQEGGTYTRATLGYALARAGELGEAAEILSELHAHVSHEYVSPVAFATLYLGLGNIEGALDYAEQAVADRRGWLAYLKVNPIMDPMRGHPRFQALVRRMKL